MTFSEIKYERVDIQALKDQIASMTERLRAAADFDQAERCFLEMNDLDGRTMRTMRTVAQIRRDIDTRDEFYDAEMKFYNRELPTVQPVKQAWTNALLASPFRAKLEEKYGDVAFLNAELANRTFRPELVEDLQRENELVSRYTKLLASAQIPFDGKICTVSQMQPYKLSTDDKLRRAAWRAEGQWYADQSRELDAIYDELVKLRDGMGRKLGHNGYTQLGYDRMQRNCYTEQDVERFRVAVQQYVVPLTYLISSLLTFYLCSVFRVR